MTDAAKLARNLCVTEEEIRGRCADSFVRMNERRMLPGWWILPVTLLGALAWAALIAVWLLA